MRSAISKHTLKALSQPAMFCVNQEPIQTCEEAECYCNSYAKEMMY